MAVLIYSEISDRALDACQANVTTDAPVSATEMARFINQAYAAVWSESGGRLKRVAQATAWSIAATTTAGFMTGLLTDIEDVTAAWNSTASGSIGGEVTTDTPLDRVELEYLYHLRNAQGYGSYSDIKCFAISRNATTTVADVNKVRIDFWPAIASRYIPIHYVPQFTPIDSATVTTPDVNDLESHDIAYITASRIAPLIGRAELVPSILSMVTTVSGLAAVRKLMAMVDAKQDDARNR